MAERGVKRVAAAVVLGALPAGLAFAGTLDPWDTGLTKIMALLQGPTAAVIGGLCIVGGGILLAVTEGQALKRMFWIVIGIGVAMNGGKILTVVIPGAVDPSTVQGFLVWAHGAANALIGAASQLGGPPWIFS